MDAINYVNDQLLHNSDMPAFRPGDNIVVSYKIVEGDKERIQDFRGDVLQIKGRGKNKSFTVRKVSNGIGVERIFPMSSPNIVEVRLLKKGHVRRSKLFYLRERIGRKARIRERTVVSKQSL
ncbi:MAG: 50S ribosomal protein L19 [Saprospiraceae bacterium]|nr:50S ribosomal protein L19 [Saprospiraceae bacterium]